MRVNHGDFSSFPPGREAEKNERGNFLHAFRAAGGFIALDVKSTTDTVRVEGLAGTRDGRLNQDDAGELQASRALNGGRGEESGRWRFSRPGGCLTKRVAQASDRLMPEG